MRQRNNLENVLPMEHAERFRLLGEAAFPMEDGGFALQASPIQNRQTITSTEVPQPAGY
jgi:hypothetical protein